MAPTDEGEQGGKRRLAGLLARRFFLRFHLSLILGFSFVVGLLFTKLLLVLGVDSPLWRWPLAVFAAYGASLLGIRVWLAYVGLGRHLGRDDGDGSLEIPDLNFSGGSGSSGSSYGSGFRMPELPADASYASGNFGGGGASGDYAALDAGGSLGDALPEIKLPDVDLGGADEGCLPILVLLLILALLAAVFGVGVYIVWQAPYLLTEAAFEAALAAGLVRSARRVDDPGWIGGAMRASWKPFLWILLLTCAAAAVVEYYVPQARTLLEAIHLLRELSSAGQ